MGVGLFSRLFLMRKNRILAQNFGDYMMNYRINKNDPSPAYYRTLRRQIEAGIYKYGQKLPSKRFICDSANISVITVEHAYSILCDEGYVESIERRGYFVIYKRDDFVSHNETHDSSPHPAQKIQAPQSAKGDFPLSVLTKAMRKVTLDIGDGLLVKSPNFGCERLREAISSYLARSSEIHASKEQIIVGSGAEYLYSLILQLLGKNRIFALEDPSYSIIKKVYETNGIICDMLKIGKNGIKSSELERSAATVLHVTPFNSYPSGITADISKRLEYLKWAQKRNGYIIEDNYESELTVSKKNDDTLFSLSKDGRVIYLNTFSKTVAPSIRVGYMILPSTLLSEFEKKLGFYSCTVPVFEQYLLAELIESGDFERHISRVRRKRRELAKKGQKEQKD